MDKEEALRILRREEKYEDDLAIMIDTDILVSLKGVGLTEDQVAKLTTRLRIIMQESIGHREVFRRLIKRVEDGKAEI